MADLKAQRRFLSNPSETKLQVDLTEVFGVEIDDGDLRQAIGQKIIDQIRERTAEGRGLDGKFPKYSKSYIDSQEFQAFGKSADSVNLTLTGDMLSLMDIVEDDPKKITIGWDDSTNAEKAHGHISGAVGKKRDFLGLKAGEINDLRREFSSQVKSGGLGEKRSGTISDILKRVFGVG